LVNNSRVSGASRLRRRTAPWISGQWSSLSQRRSGGTRRRRRTSTTSAASSSTQPRSQFGAAGMQTFSGEFRGLGQQICFLVTVAAKSKSETDHTLPLLQWISRGWFLGSRTTFSASRILSSGISTNGSCSRSIPRVIRQALHEQSQDLRWNKNFIHTDCQL